MSRDILERPVTEALVAMAAPAAIGMLLTFLFQLVDTYFLGKLSGTALAAISFAYPVYILIVSLFMGVAAGVSSTVGKALGESRPDKAGLLTSTSLVIFMLFTMGLGAVGFVSTASVFSLLGATAESLPLVSEYMRILYLGMFALVGTLIGNAALMAKGIMIKPTVIIGIGGLLNLILDYVLIFGIGPIPAMEVKGAALATVISWGISLVIMLVVLFREGLLSPPRAEWTGRVLEGLREIWVISTPAVAAQILNPIAIAVITRLVATSGDNAVAAYGIATRVESLGLTGMLSLSVILTPLVAQNFGAERKGRLDEIIAYSGRMTVYWGIALYVLISFFAESIGSVFTDNVEIIRHTRNYLYIVGISFAGFGLALITTSFFNGVYEPRLSLKLTLVKTLAFTIPLALVGGLVSLTGIWIGLAVANLAGAVYANILLEKWLVKNGSVLVGHNPLVDYLDDARALMRKIKGPDNSGL